LKRFGSGIGIQSETNTNALTDTVGQNSAISFSLRHLGTPVDVVVNTLVGSVPVKPKKIKFNFGSGSSICMNNDKDPHLNYLTELQFTYP
jgi:hypothetical protein